MITSSVVAACGQARIDTNDARYDGIVFLGDSHASRIDAPRARPRPQRTAVPSPEVSAEDDAYGAMFDWLCRARGLQPRRYRASAIRRRERACARAVGTTSVQQAMGQAARTPGLVDRGLSAVLIGVTSFFRDAAAFEALQREISQPAWSARRSIDVVSLACSDGCELYSVGMLLAQRSRLSTARLWGVDCRPAAVERARAGAYSASTMESLDAELRRRWFTERGGGACVRDELRERATWAVGDAFAFDQPAQADLILCRNLAIYLRHESAQELWRLLAARLRPGGLLMVGKAERASNVPDLRWVGPCLYRKSEVNS